MNHHGNDDNYIEKVQRIYSDLTGDLHLVELERNGASGLGISLVGNRDTATMSVFVAAVHPFGLAASDGRIQVGDELLEINGHVLFGRSHLNASPIIKGITSSRLKILLLRNYESLQRMAVDPLKSMTIDYKCDTSSKCNETVNSSLENYTSQKQAQEQTKKPKLQLKILAEETELNESSYKEINDKETPSDSNQVQSSHVAIIDDPVTCSIISGKPTTISIAKGKQALGVQIIGGSDTSLKSVFVFEIYKEGAAAKDGRLAFGDQILEANSEDLITATHVQALQILRRPTAAVRMVVLREKSAFQEDDLCESLAVELTKKPGKGLGLSIVSKRDGAGILITDIIKGGAAETDGRLIVGDEVISVNGEDVHSATQEYAANLLKTVTGKVSLLVRRMKNGLRPVAQLSSAYVNMYSEGGLKKSESHAVDCKSAGKQVSKSMSVSKSY